MVVIRRGQASPPPRPLNLAARGEKIFSAARNEALRCLVLGHLSKCVSSAIAELRLLLILTELGCVHAHDAFHPITRACDRSFETNRDCDSLELRSVYLDSITGIWR